MESDIKEKKPEKKTKQIGTIARFAKLSIKKKIQYAAILLLIIVILAIYFASFGTTEPVQESAQQNEEASAALSNIETKLIETLSHIDGAGRVKVMITYESSSEIVPALSIDKQSSTTTDEGESGSSTTTSENTQSEVVTISTSNGNSALVLRENCPKVKGVLVIAEGADDIGVKLDLLAAVQTILDISPDKVDVYKMNNE